jgi:hypothetical protein
MAGARSALTCPDVEERTLRFSEDATSARVLTRSEGRRRADGGLRAGAGRLLRRCALSAAASTQTFRRSHFPVRALAGNTRARAEPVRGCVMGSHRKIRRAEGERRGFRAAAGGMVRRCGRRRGQQSNLPPFSSRTKLEGQALRRSKSELGSGVTPLSARPVASAMCALLNARALGSRSASSQGGGRPALSVKLSQDLATPVRTGAARGRAIEIPSEEDQKGRRRAVRGTLPPVAGPPFRAVWRGQLSNLPYIDLPVETRRSPFAVSRET